MTINFNIEPHSLASMLKNYGSDNSDICQVVDHWLNASHENISNSAAIISTAIDHMGLNPEAEKESEFAANEKSINVLASILVNQLSSSDVDYLYDLLKK